MPFNAHTSVPHPHTHIHIHDEQFVSFGWKMVTCMHRSTQFSGQIFAMCFFLFSFKTKFITFYYADWERLSCKNIRWLYIFICMWRIAFGYDYFHSQFRPKFPVDLISALHIITIVQLYNCFFFHFSLSISLSLSVESWRRQATTTFCWTKTFGLLGYCFDWMRHIEY